MRSYSNFIGGEWVAARTGQNYQNFNPADTREFVAQYPRSGKEEAGEAVQAAQKAWPAWAAMTPVARGRILGKASQILETRKAELAELLTREEGKTLAESAGEVQRAIDIFRFFSGLSYTLGGQTLPHDLPGNLLFTVRQPLGVVGLITPWNFPIAIPAWKMAPALVCGNAVVIKPASPAPAPTLELAKALHEAGLPPGVVDGLKVGNGLTPGVEMGPAVNQQELDGNFEHLKIAQAEGAKLAWGGQRLAEGVLAHGFFMQPAVLANVTPVMRIAREEVFGPVVAVMAAGWCGAPLALASGVNAWRSACRPHRALREAWTPR